jgi:hypothetical protein
MRGASQLSLGGGTTARPEDSLFRFKAKFSPIQRQVFVATRVHMRDVYDRIVAAWARTHPELVPTRGHFALCYRELPDQAVVQ